MESGGGLQHNIKRALQMGIYAWKRRAMREWKGGCNTTYNENYQWEIGNLDMGRRRRAGMEGEGVQHNI